MAEAGVEPQLAQSNKIRQLSLKTVLLKCILVAILVANFMGLVRKGLVVCSTAAGGVLLSITYLACS